MNISSTKLSAASLFANPLFLIIETTYLIIIPLVLISFFPKIMLFRTLIMLASLGYIAIVMNKLNISITRLGFQKQNFKHSLISISPLVILSLICIFALYSIFPKFTVLREILNETAFIPLPFGIVYYVFLSVPLQEIIFFGFYLTRLMQISHNKIFLTIYCALVFMLIHVPFMHGRIYILIGTFVMGIILSSNFLKYRNIYTLIISHWCIGTSVILLESLRL